MSVDTATVETLTAEVRVLMVGSRQVTLSVAKQLDRVDLADLAVMGRVNLTGGDFVIGSRRGTGELALAKYAARPRPAKAWIEHGDPGTVTVCRSLRSDLNGDYRLDLNGIPFAAASGDVTVCDVVGHQGGYSGSCEGWTYTGDLAALERTLRARLEVAEADRARELAAAEAPLIVLAGLR